MAHMSKQFIASFLVLLAILTALLVQKIPSPDRRFHGATHSTSYITTADINATQQVLFSRAPSGYAPENYFNLYGFEKATTIDAQGRPYSLESDYKNIFSHTLLEVYAVLIPAVKVMQDQKSFLSPNHPTYIRYFKGSQRHAIYVYAALLGVALGIGMPGVETQRQNPACPLFPKLDVWFGTPPDSINPPREGRLECIPFRWDGDYQTPPPSAFRFTKWQDGQIVGDGIALCEQFFRYWRNMNAVEKDKQYIWGYIEFGFQDAVDEPTYLSALVLLHELLHVRHFYSELGFPLQDQDRSTGISRTMYRSISDLAFMENAVTPKELLPAYGARAAWCLNNNYAAYWDDQSDVPMVEQDPPYPTTWVGSLWNVDNYISFTKEIFFLQKYQDDEALQGRLQQGWMAPPSRAHGPHFPVGHPGLAPGRFYRALSGLIDPNQPVIDAVNGPTANMAPMNLKARFDGADCPCV